MSPADVAVRVRGLSKQYKIAHGSDQASTLGEALTRRLRHPFRKPKTDTFWALKDVDFEIQRGDVVGIIGRNGAGKSTLLKILSRITEPTSGQIDLFGRVGSLLEVGTGFHPELTGRENVFLNGAILGMRKSEIAEQFDDIVEFAEIGPFLDTPVKRYSSGMYVRLAFAVAAHLRSEILIIDEVLAVGDFVFQQKCLGKMRDLSAGGRTVLFVSHQVATVRSLCHRAILMSSGSIAIAGGVEEVVARYLADGARSERRDLGSLRDREGSGEIRCTRVRILSMDGVEIPAVPPGAPFRVEVGYKASQRCPSVVLSIDVDSPEGYRITTLYSGFQNVTFPVEPGEGSFVCTVDALPLSPDSYRANVMIGHHAGWYDLVRDAFTLVVEPADVFGTGRIPQRAHGATLSNYNWSRS